MASSNLVLRTIYISPTVDDRLRDEAYSSRTSKNDLIRRYLEAGMRALSGDAHTVAKKTSYKTAAKKAPAKKVVYKAVAKHAVAAKKSASPGYAAPAKKAAAKKHPAKKAAAKKSAGHP